MTLATTSPSPNAARRPPTNNAIRQALQDINSAQSKFERLGKEVDAGWTVLGLSKKDTKQYEFALAEYNRLVEEYGKAYENLAASQAAGAATVEKYTQDSPEAANDNSENPEPPKDPKDPLVVPPPADFTDDDLTHYRAAIRRGLTPQQAEIEVRFNRPLEGDDPFFKKKRVKYEDLPKPPSDFTDEERKKFYETLRTFNDPELIVQRIIKERGDHDPRGDNGYQAERNAELTRLEEAKRNENPEEPEEEEKRGTVEITDIDTSDPDLPAPRTGNISFEKGAKPSEDEMKAAEYFLQQGHDVTYLKKTQSRRADLNVAGIGPVEVKTISGTKTNSETISRRAETAGKQSDTAFIQVGASTPPSEINSAAERLWNKKSNRARNIETLYVQTQDGRVYRFDRPNGG